MRNSRCQAAQSGTGLPSSSAPWRMKCAVQAHSCTQTLARQVDVRQAQRHERARRVLGQAAVAHLAESPQPLDDAEHMLDSGSHSGLGAIDQALELLRDAALAHLLVGEVLCMRGLRFDQLPLARIRAVAPDVLLLSRAANRAADACRARWRP